MDRKSNIIRNEGLVKHLKDISALKTSHGFGQKFIFFKEENVNNGLTQVAIGELTNMDNIGLHSHPSMDEYFYFLEGSAKFTIGNSSITCYADTFVRVPKNNEHKISTTDYVKFLYWGIAV